MNLETATAPARPSPMDEKANKNAQDTLRGFVERVERIQEKMKVFHGDIIDVYMEAQDGGYDVKALRRIVALRKMNPNDRAEADAMLSTCNAPGMH